VLQLKNDVSLATSMAVFPNVEGVDTLYVVTKAALTLFPKLVFAEKAPAVTLADDFWGELGTSSVRSATELHVGKGGTDVVLVGHARAEGGRSVREALVSVSIAERRKLVRVFGDRTWKSSGFSAPEPFESMPLVFERAFGGTAARDDGRVEAEERNPVGRGFLGKRSASTLVGTLLPNLEDPRRPLARPGDAQDPACFSFVAPSWMPRRAHAGTYDHNWKRQRAPYLPRDFRSPFFNSAAPELIFDRFLSGGERVEILGACRQGPLSFVLPTWAPTLEITLAGRTESPRLELETLLLEPDENRACLTWRAALPCDKKIHKIAHVLVRGRSTSVEQERPV